MLRHKKGSLMITLEEVVLHMKKENAVGSDKYVKLLEYLETFSEDELLYLEIECKVKVESCKTAVSWNYMASMIALFTAIVTIISMFIKGLEIDFEFFEYGKMLLLYALVIAGCVFAQLIREVKTYNKSIRYMQILGIIHNIKCKNKDWL